jgi:hypothetical protein
MSAIRWTGILVSQETGLACMISGTPIGEILAGYPSLTNEMVKVAIADERRTQAVAIRLVPPWSGKKPWDARGANCTCRLSSVLAALRGNGRLRR